MLSDSGALGEAVDAAICESLGLALGVGVRDEHLLFAAFWLEFNSWFQRQVDAGNYPKHRYAPLFWMHWHEAAEAWGLAPVNRHTPLELEWGWAMEEVG